MRFKHALTLEKECEDMLEKIKFIILGIVLLSLGASILTLIIIFFLSLQYNVYFLPIGPIMIN